MEQTVADRNLRLMNNMIDVMRDPESYRPCSDCVMPSIPDAFRTYAYLEALVLDAFRAAKLCALTEDRHMFDIARSRAGLVTSDAYVYQIYRT
jgi:hypothetical protein